MLDFALQGEIDPSDMIFIPDLPDDPVERYLDEGKSDRCAARQRAEAKARRLPVAYPASRFLEHCHAAASEHLERHISELCLNPSARIEDGEPWFFPTLVSSLRQWLAEHSGAQKASEQNTAIGKSVCDTLDYVLETGKMGLIVGRERRGKSHSAKAWCARHPGQVRYLEVPSTNDDKGFYREIAKSLGVSTNLNSKAQELRERIEETLQDSKLMLVLDEAHYIWPQRYYNHSTPVRVNWIMTALVNHGVPVALIATPQFFKSQAEIEKTTHWNSRQFNGRIGHYESLPEKLSAADLSLVAKAMLPEGDARSIESLADYAEGSKGYLGTVENAVTRAKYLARRSGRDKVIYSDVKQAILESVIPSDSALAAALEPVARPRRSVPVKASATPLQPRFSAPERSVPTTGERNRIADLEAAPA